MLEQAHPQLYGFDVYTLGTILAASPLMMLVAIWLALGVRDPHKRVKALNERREQLKAGIASQGPKSAPSFCAATTPPTRSAASSTS
jgi:tight adherence protein C